MFRHPIFAAWFVSSYLLAYILFLSTGAKLLQEIADSMFLFSPVFVLWMSYSIIRYGQFSGNELEEGQEFGYTGRPTDTLDIM